MSSFLKILIIVITILAVAAILTKPSDDTCYTKVKEALENAHHQVAIYIEHKKNSDEKVISSITIKDRILYKEIYFFEVGSNKKVAIGALTKIFLISHPK